MIGENIVIANIAWSEDYKGGNLEGWHRFVQTYGTGFEVFNFKPDQNGSFHGYIRAGNLEERAGRNWTVVFVSKPQYETGLRVVGWYEDAEISEYYERTEYEYDRNFPTIPNGSVEIKYTYNLISRKAFVVPKQYRDDLFLPKGHPIKSAGIYFVSGLDNKADTPAQSQKRREIADWLRRALPHYSARSTINPPSTEQSDIPSGITVDDGGHPHGFSPEGESEAHRSLREWTMKNSLLVAGLEGNPIGRTEVSLLSGDRVDVVYDDGDTQYVVEVKSHRTPKDHTRGVYQCIKYRAVAAAMDEKKKVKAILVTEENLISADQKILKTHGISHYIAPRSRD